MTLEQTTRGATRPASEYRYRLNDDGSITLREFLDQSGALWRMLPLPGNRQRWDLMNGAGGKSLSLQADRVSVTSHNSLVIEYRSQRTTRKLDGTEIIETTYPPTADGVVRKETKVGVKGKDAAITLTTYADHTGRRIKQELHSASGRYVRQGLPREFKTIGWHEVGKDGRVNSAPAWFGELLIDGEGTVIRRFYETEPRPDRQGELRARLQRDVHGNPILDARGGVSPITHYTVYHYTDGESEWHLAHGGVVRRDAKKNVLWMLNARGEFTRFDYSDDGAITGIQTNGESWSFNRKTGKFRVHEKQKSLSPGSSTHVALDRKLSPEMKRTNLVTDDATTDYLDGSVQHQRANGTRTIANAAGALLGLRDHVGRELKLEYARDGKLVRVVGLFPDGSAIFTVVDTDYRPTRERPLPDLADIGTRAMSLRGWGDEKFVSAIDGRGRRVDMWLDGTRVSYDAAEGGNVVRVTMPTGLRIVREGYLEPHEQPSADTLDVARHIAPVSGGGPDKSVAYVIAGEHKIERFADGSLRIRDALGRLLLTIDAGGGKLTFSYAGSGADPVRVEGATLELTREAEKASPTTTLVRRNGDAFDRHNVRRF